MVTLCLCLSLGLNMYMRHRAERLRDKALDQVEELLALVRKTTATNKAIIETSEKMREHFRTCMEYARACDTLPQKLRGSL